MKIKKDFKYDLGSIKTSRKNILVFYREKYFNKYLNKEKNRYYCRCLKCGLEFWFEEEKMNKCHCLRCSTGYKILISGINDIPTTAPWMVKYFQGGYEEAKKYTKRSGKKLIFKCPSCGKIGNSLVSICNLYKNRSIGCSCSDKISYPNKFMHSILSQLQINFKNEYRPDWCSFVLNDKKTYGKYDFYFELNNKKFIVEMDGNFHTTDNKMNGQTKEDSQFKDSEKDRLALENNCEMIRIDSDPSDHEFIKNNILKSRLNEVLDLSKVDWLKVEEFTTSSLVKKVCELYNSKKFESLIDIGQIVNLGRATIRKYLKQGNLLEWCIYDPEEEKIKGREKGKITNRKYYKQIELYINSKFIKEFESIAECSRQSEKILGYRIYTDKIIILLKNGQENRKGISFKYSKINL